MSFLGTTGPRRIKAAIPEQSRIILIFFHGRGLAGVSAIREKRAAHMLGGLFAYAPEVRLESL